MLKFDMHMHSYYSFDSLNPPEKIVEISEQTIQKLIYPVGFYKIKAKRIKDISQTLIDSMNDLNGFKIACDIPSGIDEFGCVSSVAFCADVTVTMGARKESLYMDGVKDIVGEITRVGLGIRYNVLRSPSRIAQWLYIRLQYQNC